MAEDPITRPCPKCFKQLRLSEKVRGRRVRCNACKTVLAVSAETWELTVSEGSAAQRPSGPTAAPAAPRSAAPPSLPSGGGPPAMPSSAGPPTLPGGPSAMPSPPTLPSAAANPPPLVDTGGTPAQRYATRARRKTSKWPLIVVAVAIMLLAAGGLVAAWMLISGGSGASHALRYLPDDCDVVLSVNVSPILDSKIYQRVKSENPEVDQTQQKFVQTFGVSFSDLSRITVGLKASKEEPVVVAEFAKSIDQKALLGKLLSEWKDEKQGGYTVYVSPKRFDPSVCFPDDRTAIIGTTEQLKAVLERNGAAKFSSALQARVDQLDFSQALAVGAVIPEDVDLPELPGLPMGMPNPLAMLEGIQAATFHVHIGSDLRLSAAAVCKDAETAENMKAAVDGLLAMVRQGMEGDQMTPDERQLARELMDSIEINRTGSNISLRMAISENVINRALDEMK